jgi:hypothetical protein
MIRTKEFSYRIFDEVAVLETNGNVTIELNYISYNGGTPKWDIRAWKKDDDDGDKVILKGITMSSAGLSELGYAIDKLRKEGKIR